MASTPMPALERISTPLMITLPPVAPIIKIQQEANKNGPDDRLQVTEQLLYENEFPGHAYVTAHLQRIQNGLYDDENLHTKDTLHVTFVAITFVLHPERSISHRFESVVIEITARSTHDKQLRFLKYAPHAAYGRMSTESLKWNFQLGASVGITKCPVGAAVNPSMAYSKDKVVGTMMKIQGSTRSTFHRTLSGLKEHRRPDTKLVWSMEENSQQESGLPREFTFVFLMQRPSSEVQQGSCEKPMSHKLLHLHHAQGDGYRSPNGELESILPPVIPEFPTSSSLIRYGLDGHESPKASPKPLHLSESEQLARQLDPDYDQVFTPVQFSIRVMPVISNSINAATLDIPEKSQESIVYGEVGQKFPTGGIHGEHADHCIDGMYNFAKLPGNFEDLMELPGSSITSVEPTLPSTS